MRGLGLGLGFTISKKYGGTTEEHTALALESSGNLLLETGSYLLIE